VTKKISWREGDLIEYEDRLPRIEIGRVLKLKSEERPKNWRIASPLVVRRIRDNETVEVREEEITGRADVIAATAALAHAPLSMRFRHVTQGDHVHVDVFTGPPGATLANAGKLVMRQDEWTTFVLAMTSLGSILPTLDVSFVERE
jgi:hypothetical protein